jgi:hypothetical protein
MTQTFSDTAAAYFAATTRCPRCDTALVRVGICVSCRADVSGDAAVEVRRASLEVVEAIRMRQLAIDALPTVAYKAPAPIPSLPVVARPAGDPREGSQISVQSVLAVVGAGLLAIAAIVFTFFNPGLTNFDTRTAIIAVTTVIFLGGAWLLARAKLQFSAEAVGALGMVFVALDVWAFSSLAPTSISPYVFAGIGTLVSAAAMIGIASLARIRSWLWLGLIGLEIAPAWFGYAVGTAWSVLIGHLGVAFVVLAVHEVAKLMRGRFGTELRSERMTASIVEVIAVSVVSLQTLTLLADTVQVSVVYLALTLLALLSARNHFARFWSFLSGAFFGAAFIVLSFSSQLPVGGWHATLPPLLGAVALAITAIALRLRTARHKLDLRAGAVVIGGMSAMLAATVFATAIAFAQYILPFRDPFAHDFELGATAGLAAAALGLLSARVFAPTTIGMRLRATTLLLAICFGGAALVTFAGWHGFPPGTRVAIALGCAVVLSRLLSLLLPLVDAPRTVRLPLIIGVHLLVLEAAIVAWNSNPLSIIGGAAVVAALVPLALTVPRVIRPVYTAVGFAYALIVFAHALSLTQLETVAILCLTTTLASVTALAVTLLRRIPARHWYAILAVTSLPFVVGVVSVLFERSGWTGLSTLVTFALALTLLVSRRPGLSTVLRTIAAALLVPALAVAVICIGAQLLVSSGSPVTLPIIAVIVACALPSTQLIEAALVRHGLASPDARLARIAIEASSLVTAVFAVFLALVRSAAGLNISFLVLLIIGLGAAASGYVTHRRYPWIVAAAAWTGALWCGWGILGVSVIEPYILPPAIAATLVGAIAVVRKLPGIGLYAVGLACAVVPSLAVLAIWGNGGSTPWRAYGLLAASAVLIALGGVMSRRQSGSQFGMLATPTLLVGMAAAAGGPTQAVRWAWGLDPLSNSTTAFVMTAVLTLSAVSAALAAIAGRYLITPARLVKTQWRWVYVPASVYLVVGPIAAERSGWFVVWTLWLLTLALLALMIVTVLRASRRPTALPPVWVTFVLAWIVAVVGWSDRALRVEAFSLPLGLALLAVGIIAMVWPSESKATLTSWPVGYSGSWRLLTLGIVVTFLPSVLATGTDPQTLRAVLVIAMALVAILIGSLRKLGAPFVLGIVVLPIENITIFAVQAGHSISPTSWWITLATAGAVLLVIAVTYERRTTGEKGVAARLRDLR